MKKITKLCKVLLVLIGLFLVGNFVLYVYCLLTPKMEINQAQSYYLYDKDDALVFNDNDNWIKLDNISSYLKDATLVTEDKYFYHHIGFDYLRIIKAMYSNVLSGSKKEGASTITQQYARNLYLNFDKTWKRKIEEAILAFELETHYSKDEIFEGYLNTINYGGVFGIENASLYYFNKSASDLTLAEASMLAGIPKSPANYSPLVNEELAKSRQKLILKLLYDNEKITKEEYESARIENLVYYGASEDKTLTSVMYFQDAVVEELNSIDTIPASLITTGGLKIYTTMDTKAQELLENSIDTNIDDDSDIQASGIVMNPTDGSVLALIGGVDYNKSQFNRAINSKRQVGSVMKPFLYYSALENGFTSSSSFISERTTFTFSGDKTYSPKNYNDKYADSSISMAAAIAYSDNIYAVKTHLFLGEEVLVNMARRVGISSDLQAIPSLALGSQELSLMDMVRGYSSFANEGNKVKSHLIRKVVDSSGNILYEFKDESEDVLNKSITFILNELLTSTYDKSFIDYNYPTVISLLPQITNKYAIKTGTTDTDTWIIGYNKDLVVGIWNGYDDNRLISDKDYNYGKDIWVDTMEGYFNDKQATWYDIPNNVVGVMVDAISGKIVTEASDKSKIFYYIKGTEPYYETADLDKVFNNEE
ncbi:MAG: transglycosylase domain-containing protein [bacterium]|nr:transglycosylase domain-containing protein [bacterium]